MATMAVTPDRDAVQTEIFIAAPPERVFQAITDPDQATQWWGQQGVYRVTEWKGDLRPGSKWSSAGVGADGTSFRVDGEYLGCQLERPPKDHGTLGAGAPGDSWSAARWTPEDGHGHDAETPSRRICRRSESRT
jgi:uncharacterized protein YndB with AHSA1/START domain